MFKKGMLKHMILGVKKKNFILYVIFLFFGISLIVLAFAFIYVVSLKEILLCLGCGFVPTALTAYFTDRINLISENEKNQNLREVFLFGLPYSVAYVAKIIIEEYYSNALDREVFKEAFEQSVEEMSKITTDDINLNGYENKKILKKLSNAFLYYKRDSESLINNKHLLIINNVFSASEIHTITYMKMDIENIEQCYIIAEIADYLKLFVNGLYDKFPEVRAIFDRQAIIEKKHIKNWTELSA